MLVFYLCLVKLDGSVGSVDVLIVISSYPADLNEAWENFNMLTNIKKIFENILLFQKLMCSFAIPSIPSEIGMQ